MSSGGPGQCDGCGESTWLLPLHGDGSGPLRCFKCAGEWNARHSRKRKAGRIVIKALKLFDEAGGSYADVNKLRLVASGISLPGYEADTLGVEIGDITLELLMDALVLCHPDRHPVERKELAIGMHLGRSRLCPGLGRVPQAGRRRLRPGPTALIEATRSACAEDQDEAGRECRPA